MSIDSLYNILIEILINCVASTVPNVQIAHIRCSDSIHLRIAQSILSKNGLDNN